MFSYGSDAYNKSDDGCGKYDRDGNIPPAITVREQAKPIDEQDGYADTYQEKNI